MSFQVGLFALVEAADDIREYMGISYINAYLTSNGIASKVNVITRMQMDEVLASYDEFPQIIGISLYCNTVELTKEFCKKIKEKSPKCYVVLGGAHVMGYEEDILERMKDVDAVCTGEGELTFLELSHRLMGNEGLRGCKGITYREGKSIIKNERREDIRNLDRLPWPDREYNLNNKKRYLYITGSRGCAGICTFCGEHKTAGCGVRLRNPVDIVDEMESLWKKYSVDKFHFTDATFEDPGEIGLERAKNIFREIIKRKLKFRLVMYTRTNVVTHLDDNYYDLAYKAGVECYFVGVESGNQKDLDLFQKRITVEDNYKVIKKLLSHKIYVNYGFICFNPYSTFEQIRENIEFLYNSGLIFNSYHILSKLTIMPQSKLKEKMLRDGLIDEFHFDSDIRSYKFINSEVEELHNFLSQRIHTKHLIDLDSQIGIDRFHYEKEDFDFYNLYLKNYFDDINQVWKERNEYLYNFFIGAIDIFMSEGISNNLEQYIDSNQIFEFDKKIRNLYRRYNAMIYKKRKG